MAFEEVQCELAQGTGGAQSCLGGKGSPCKLFGEWCNSALHYLNTTLTAETVRTVAVAHPRVAGTLWSAVQDGMLHSEGSIHWPESPLTAADIETLMAGRPIAWNKPTGSTVVYRYALDQDPATGRWSLVITPQQPSDLDPPFAAFLLELEPARDSGGYVAGEWWLF